jgi:hypothetical protein
MKSRKRNLAEVKDLWAAPPAKEEYFEWSETRTFRPQSQKRSKYVPSYLPSVEPPSHAASYNPDREEHQRAVVEAINEQIHNIREYKEVERQVRAPRKKDPRSQIFGLRKFSKAELAQLASPATRRGEGSESSDEDSSDDDSDDSESDGSEEEDGTSDDDENEYGDIDDGEEKTKPLRKKNSNDNASDVKREKRGHEKSHKLHDGHLTKTERNQLRRKERNVRLSRKHQRRKERRLVPFEAHLDRAHDAISQKEARKELSLARHVRKEERARVKPKKLGSVGYTAMAQEPVLEEELPSALRQVAGTLVRRFLFLGIWIWIWNWF